MPSPVFSTQIHAAPSLTDFFLEGSDDDLSILFDKRIVNGKQVHTAIPIKGEKLKLVYEVDQGFATIAQAGSRKNRAYLYTSGVTICIAIVIFDPINNLGAIAHIDLLKKAAGLQEIIDAFPKESALQLSIVGGYTRPTRRALLGFPFPSFFQEGFGISASTNARLQNMSLGILKEIKGVLRPHKARLDISEINLGLHPQRPLNVGLDLNSGELFATEQGPSKTEEIVRARNSRDKLIINNAPKKTQKKEMEQHHAFVVTISSKIDRALETLNQKILGANKVCSEKALAQASTLLSSLNEAQRTYKMELQKPGGSIVEASEAFKKTCSTLIKRAIPLLERELGWGDYLSNLLKTIVNSICQVMTCGQSSSFFTHARTELTRAVEETELATEEAADLVYS